MSTLRAYLLVLCVAAAASKAINYEKASGDKEPVLRPVMIPISSTVIPLDDLPVYKVGFGFGLAGKTVTRRPDAQEAKVEEKRNYELITKKNAKARTKKPYYPPKKYFNRKKAYVPRFNYAKIQQINKEDFKQWKPTKLF